MRRRHAGGAEPAAPEPLMAEWDALRLRAEAHGRALADAEARDDAAALRALCKEGLELVRDLEAFAAAAIAEAAAAAGGQGGGGAGEG